MTTQRAFPFATPWLETDCKKDAPVAGMRGDHPQPDTRLTEKADGLATLQLRLTHSVKVLDPSIEPLLDLPALLSRVWIRVDVAVVTVTYLLNLVANLLSPKGNQEHVPLYDFTLQRQTEGESGEFGAHPQPWWLPLF